MVASQTPKTAVVDASVALKWQLDDEREADQALALRDDLLIRKRIVLYAPSLYFYELINGITSAVRRQRLQRSQGEEALRNLLAVEVTLRTPAADRTYTIAAEYGLSAYDSSYVALAESLESDLWTADRALYDAVSPQVSRVRWIGDYPVA